MTHQPGPPLDVLRTIFKAAPFIANLGIELDTVNSGECTTSLRVLPHHLQQNGVIHAGVISTMADHTAGGAAASLMSADQHPLTAQFTINLLRTAKAPSLICRARVIKAGKSLSIAESEVFSVSDGVEIIVAKALVTLAVISTKPGHEAGPA
jgi:uncharacterized protein (TIGR00369 family)